MSYATLKQPPPTGAGSDVSLALATWLADRYGVDLAISSVIARDVEARVAAAAEKYGQRLHTKNGRDPLIDAYQEAADLVAYLFQAHMECECECDGATTDEHPTVHSLLLDALALVTELRMLFIGC